jgi:hypothetical protein
VFIDESGANIAMGRSHAWVRRGEEYVERRPMNWGTNLTLIGAIRHDRWLTLSTRWRAVTKHTFTAWVRQRLAPRLRPGDVVLLDNLRAHTDPAVRVLIERRGAQLRFLPPYSYDFNPIEAAWALVKKRIRGLPPAHGPRPATSRTSGPPRDPSASFPTVVCPCRLRQLKYFPGLGATARLAVLVAHS